MSFNAQTITAETINVVNGVQVAEVAPRNQQDDNGGGVPEKIPFAFSKCEAVVKVGQSVYSGKCIICGRNLGALSDS